MDKSEIVAVKEALRRVPNKTRARMVRDAAKAGLQEVWQAKQIAELLAAQTTRPQGNGVGRIGSAELLFKLSLFLEENDLWDAVTRSSG